jgi:hypothetical protein
MTLDELHQQFKLELDKTTALELPAFLTAEVDDWLNIAVRKFVKTRYSGVNVKQEAFEQTQKRSDDLRTLIREQALICTTGSVKPNSYIADLTTLTFTYWLALGEESLIGYQSISDSTSNVASGSLVVGQIYKVTTASIINGTTSYAVDDYFMATATTYTGSGGCVLQSQRRVPVKEATIDTYSSLLDDPYSEHILHYDEAEPLRLFYQDSVELIGDGNYGVVRYYLRYLKAPQTIDISTDVASGSIAAGTLYEVRNADSSYVTYNSSNYYNGQTFLGVTGVLTYTESGTSTVHVTIDLPVHTHDEIVRLAVNMVLENIEQPRYQTHMVEVSTME